MPEAPLTIKALAAWLGVNVRRVYRWQEDGLAPIPKRRPMVFDPAAVRAWLSERGIVPKGLEGEAIHAAPPATAPATPPPPPGATGPTPTTPRSAAGDLGILGALERVRIQERSLAARLAQLQRDPEAGGAEIAALNRALTPKVTELRQLEHSALEYRKKIGELADFAEMKRVFSTVAAATRERVLSVPNEVAPLIRAHLANPNDAPAVKQIVEDAIRRALSAIPHDLEAPTT